LLLFIVFLVLRRRRRQYRREADEPQMTRDNPSISPVTYTTTTRHNRKRKFHENLLMAMLNEIYYSDASKTSRTQKPSQTDTGPTTNSSSEGKLLNDARSLSQAAPSSSSAPQNAQNTLNTSTPRREEDAGSIHGLSEYGDEGTLPPSYNDIPNNRRPSQRRP
jgi:hypothetical protein